MLRFKNGLLLGTFMSAAGAADTGGGGGGAGPANANFLATLPETVRGHEAFRDVKDAGDLASRYHKAIATPFAEQLPEDIRGDANFKDIKDLPSLAKSFINAQKKIGVPADRLLQLPQDDKDDKSWGEIYNKLGRPESVDKYEVPKLGDGKDYGEADKAFQQKLLPILHEAGITQRQLAAIVPKWNGILAELGMSTAQDTAAGIAAADEALTKEWGAAKSEKLALAKGAVNYFAETLKLGDGLKQALERPGPDGKPIGNDPAFSKLFAYLGETMREDGLLGKGAGGGDGALSPAEAEQQINALQADEKFMKSYTNRRDPGHADAVARMQKLYEQKTAAQAA